LPKLPPVEGHEGYAEYMQQIKLWQNWIDWEKSDPLYIKDEDLALYKSRVVYVYKQALMALQFWPEMWFDAAEFCHQNGLEDEANTFLRDGAAANPESVLLAFKLADRAEHDTTSMSTSDEDSLMSRGETVRAPFDKVLDTLYGLIGKAELRATQAIARATEESQASQLEQQPTTVYQANDDDDNDEEPEDPAAAKQKALNLKIEAIKKDSQKEVDMLKNMLSSVWIGLMRAMRRVQGKGITRNGSLVGGFRKIFTDARGRGKITSKVYIESALIEYHCYKDAAATKIFDRGMRLYPNDETFALEYLKHLIAINDVTSKNILACLRVSDDANYLLRCTSSL
jgi:cleavage stimulation factor subunit 3